MSIALQTRLTVDEVLACAVRQNEGSRYSGGKRRAVTRRAFRKGALVLEPPGIEMHVGDTFGGRAS